MKEHGEKQLAKLVDYHATFNSPSGKRVLFDLMRLHGVFTAAHGTADFVNFNEGQRLVVLNIMKKLKMDPAKLRAAYEEGESE